MPLKIRLARGGAKKRPHYRIVVTDSRNPRDGSFIEKVGVYDPMLPREHERRLQLVNERISYWLSKGAQPTDRVARFLGNAGLMKLPTPPAQTKQSLPKARAQERIRAEAEAAAAAVAAAEAAVAAAAAAAAAAVAAAAEAAAAPAPVEEAAAEAPADAAADAPVEEPAAAS